MRTIILAVGLSLALSGAADAQNCIRAWDGSLECTDASSLSPTWNGGYQSGGGSTWNRDPLDNGWNSNTGGTLRQNNFGNYTTGDRSTWSQPPLDNGLRSSGGRTCTRGLLDNVVCR
jgi:hypothetical protein